VKVIEGVNLIRIQYIHHGKTPLNNEYTFLKNKGQECKTGPR
jgi:hypothetical protein